jgi:hypothetical protein
MRPRWWLDLRGEEYRPLVWDLDALVLWLTFVLLHTSPAHTEHALCLPPAALVLTRDFPATWEPFSNWSQVWDLCRVVGCVQFVAEVLLQWRGPKKMEATTRQLSWTMWTGLLMDPPITSASCPLPANIPSEFFFALFPSLLFSPQRKQNKKKKLESCFRVFQSNLNLENLVYWACFESLVWGFVNRWTRPESCQCKLFSFSFLWFSGRLDILGSLKN